VVRYRKFLDWEIVSQPRSTRVAERALAPLLGKSAVHYATKPLAAPNGASRTGHA
jgi:hypothetical protein